MSKFKLDLTEYKVDIPIFDENDKLVAINTTAYPLVKNLNSWLRSVGIFKTGNDIAEAVSLAKGIRDCKKTSMTLDEKEAEILRAALDRFIELTAEGKANIGGEIHEEAILRVVNMKEIKKG